MNVWKSTFAAAALGAGLLGASGEAFAAPAGPASTAAATSLGTSVEAVQWYGFGGGPYYGGGYGYGYGYDRPYGPRPYYGQRFYGGGPRVVCRVRPGPYGPRRACFERW